VGKTALVIGGGFAGLEAAIRLSKTDLDVTLVSDRPFLWMYPTSIWVATGEVAPEDACLDLGSVARRHGFKFREGRVESVRGAARAVRIDGEEVRADYVLIGIGGGRMAAEGIEHTHTISGAPGSTEAFRDALEALLDKRSGRIAMGFGGNPKDPSAVRGGPGFELMFNVDTMLRRRGVRDNFELTFFAPMPSPGARMGKKAVEAVEQMFRKLGIQTRYGQKITGFAQGGAVLFEDGSRLESDLTMFIPAVDGHPIIKASDLPRNDAGFVEIDETCAVKGVDGIYAIGDAAAIDGPPWRAKQGHLAEVMARVAASNIAAIENGSPKRESYLRNMSIICLMDMGNGAAFVQRDDASETMIPLPILGHWAKKAWGVFYKSSKMRTLPGFPGMARPAYSRTSQTA